MSQLVKQYNDAIKDLKQAEHDFKNASKEYIDVAIVKWKVAEMRVDALYVEIKNQRR